MIFSLSWHLRQASAPSADKSCWAAARQSGLRFQTVQAEYYDFAIPRDHWERPAVKALRRLLAPDGGIRAELASLGFGPPEKS